MLIFKHPSLDVIQTSLELIKRMCTISKRWMNSWVPTTKKDISHHLTKGSGIYGGQQRTKNRNLDEHQNLN